MNATPAPRRARVIVSSTAVAGLFLAGAAVTQHQLSPRQPAARPWSRTAPAPFPIADVAKGDDVTADRDRRHHARAASPARCSGVLKDGIAPDLDMVMVRLSSPEIDRVGGIWQGMSGSPVYAEDGRLIGAVAYGLSWGPSPVAGVTPFEDMDDYLDAPRRPTRVKISKAAGAQHRPPVRRHAPPRPSRASPAAGCRWASPGVAAPTGLARRQDSKKHAWLPKSTYAIGAVDGATADAGRRQIVAGGNLAASLSYGDITMAGVGTTTSVCDGKVVGLRSPDDLPAHDHAEPAPRRRALHPGGLPGRAVQGREPRGPGRHHHR